MIWHKTLLGLLGGAGLFAFSNCSENTEQKSSPDKWSVVEVDGKFGFANSEGEIQIPPVWEYAYPFSEGCAVVKNNRRYGAIDRSAKEVIPFEYEWLEMFHDGRARYSENSLYGFLDKKGSVVISPSWLEAEPFSCGLSRVSRDRKKWGFIDKDGKVVIPITLDYAFSFFYDRTMIKQVKTNEHEVWGVLNKEGQIIVKPEWKQIRNLDSDYLLVSKLDDISGVETFGVMEASGKLLTELKFQNPRIALKCNGVELPNYIRESFFIADIGNQAVFVHNSGIYGQLEKNKKSYILSSETGQQLLTIEQL